MKTFPFISAIILSGGRGERMKSSLPKQYLSPLGKPLCQYSLDTLSASSLISEIIVVCEDDFQKYFTPTTKPLTFALPGKRRQDSLLQGLKKISPSAQFICIHDAARPLLQKDTLERFLKEAIHYPGAALGVPVTSTIKACSATLEVLHTLERSTLFEIQTPQLIERNTLFRALSHVQENNLSVTDDLSLLESLGITTKVILGDPSNIKVTNPIDLMIVKSIFENEKI